MENKLQNLKDPGEICGDLELESSGCDWGLYRLVWLSDDLYGSLGSLGMICFSRVGIPAKFKHAYDIMHALKSRALRTIAPCLDAFSSATVQSSTKELHWN